MIDFTQSLHDRAAKREAQLRMDHARFQLVQRAQLLRTLYGDSFADMDDNGNAILWRRTTIPAVPRKCWHCGANLTRSPYCCCNGMRDAT